MNFEQMLHSESLVTFYNPSKVDLTRSLRQETPNGGRCTRDAIIFSINSLINVGKVISSFPSSDEWHILNVFITDGEDTCSRASFNEASQAVFSLDQNLKVSSLKTFLVGIDLQFSSSMAQELTALSKSGRNIHYIPISEQDINSQIDQIKLTQGIMDRLSLPLGSAKQRYAVLFTIDAGITMQGSKFSRICDSVSQFINYLSGDDIVGAVTFSNSCKAITASVQVDSHINVNQYNQNNNLNFNQNNGPTHSNPGFTSPVYSTHPQQPLGNTNFNQPQLQGQQPYYPNQNPQGQQVYYNEPFLQLQQRHIEENRRRRTKTIIIIVCVVVALNLLSLLFYI
jgi:hypothetical protein